MLLLSEHSLIIIMIAVITSSLFLSHIASSLFIANFSSQSHFHCVPHCLLFVSTSHSVSPVLFFAFFQFNLFFFFLLHLHYLSGTAARVPGSFSPTFSLSLSSHCMHIFKWFRTRARVCVCWSTSLSQVPFDRDDDVNNKTQALGTCTRVVGVQDNGTIY